MGSLKVLPSSLVNLIAAGEVVQRPSSVVKELMENAVDALADDIRVIVTDAGSTLIQVIDNGSGMSPEDAVLCFERHATSKISEQGDLEAIRTFGFRGEALPSIASVSEICLKTRRKGDETGVEVRSEGGGKFRTSCCQTPVGSNFTVRNLFFNTPARRRFLKSDNVELRHIIEEFSRVAVTRPSISFSLNSNGRDIFVLKKSKSLKFRVQDIIGAGGADDLVDINSNTALLSLSGFVGRPQSARKTVARQFFFVNGRYFRSPFLHKAVMQAYENLIPEGTQPHYFLFIDIDPSCVDVNVSPTKSEVKFEDEGVVFQIVFASVREVLGRNSFGASIDFESPSAVQMPQLGRNFEEYRAMSSPEPATDSSYDPFRASSSGFSSHVDHPQNYGFLFEGRESAPSRVLVIQDRYIVTASASGIMLINAARAWERIMYERAISALNKTSHISQTALFPVSVCVGADMVALFEEHTGMLASLGFGLETVAPDTVEIASVPEGYSCEPGKMEALVRGLGTLLSDSAPVLPEVFNQKMAASIASLQARHCAGTVSASEAQGLVDALMACSNPELTPSGRRVLRVLNREEIDKMF